MRKRTYCILTEDCYLYNLHISSPIYYIVVFYPITVFCSLLSTQVILISRVQVAAVPSSQTTTSAVPGEPISQFYTCTLLMHLPSFVTISNILQID